MSTISMSNKVVIQCAKNTIAELDEKIAALRESKPKPPREPKTLWQLIFNSPSRYAYEIYFMMQHDWANRMNKLCAPRRRLEKLKNAALVNTECDMKVDVEDVALLNNY